MATILLLEPNRQLAKTYSQALKRAGHQVHWQNDAQAALAVLDQYALDLIVLEFHLPKHNGVEFLYEIRSYLDCDHIPVLLHTMVPKEHPGLGHEYWPQLGIQDYLYKPQSTLAQLLDRVARLTAPQLA